MPKMNNLGRTLWKIEISPIATLNSSSNIFTYVQYCYLLCYNNVITFIYIYIPIIIIHIGSTPQRGTWPPQEYFTICLYFVQLAFSFCSLIFASSSTPLIHLNWGRPCSLWPQVLVFDSLFEYRVVDLRHVKKPQAEIGASQQNLSNFSRSV